nr:TM2 domain-containing protein [uncultured Schaedlerella sp.]
MYCRSCGEEMNANQAICLKCGVKQGVGNAFCANCGKPMNSGAEICLNCGVAAKKDSDLNGNDKTTMALICFFLGGIGVHNFMMGETKKGIVKIVATLCCGVGFILALIDFIKILTNSYVVDSEKLL